MKGDKKNIYMRLVELVKPYSRRLFWAMVCMLGVAGAQPVIAYLIKPVVDGIIVERDPWLMEMLPVIVLVVFALKGLFGWGSTYLMHYVGQSVIADLRYQLYKRIINLPLTFHDSTHSGILISRITNDVNLMQGAVSSAVTGLIKDTFSAIGLVFVIFYLDWKMALIATVVLPIAFVPVWKIGRILRKIATSSQEAVADLTVILKESLGGVRIVKGFSMEDYETERFSDENIKFFGYNMKSVAARAINHPLMEFFGGIGIAALLWYSGYAFQRGLTTPGTLSSFLASMMFLYEPVKRLSGVNNTIQQGVAAAIRVFDILDKPEEVKEAEGAEEIPPVKDSIEFKDITFAYDGGTPVLEDINLKVRAGEVLALVGASGGGKTTLVSLLPRFYDVTRGAVLIDGRDVRGVSLRSLRDQIGIVTQEPVLFADTVKNNIAYGLPDKSLEDIREAARKANALRFIENLPRGFDTLIGEQGVLLSGGQRQRLCIARALLKNAPILILDEATSNLDSEAEKEVQKAMDELMEGRTTFVVAHRLSTVKNADRIVVIVDGRIVEEGTHDELMAMNGEYKKLHDLQFSPETP